MLILLSLYNVTSFTTFNFIFLINFFIQMAFLAAWPNVMYSTLVVVMICEPIKFYDKEYYGITYVLRVYVCQQAV